MLWNSFGRQDPTSGAVLFYDYERESAVVWPTPDEIRDEKPNPAGWATGMEDCCLNGGWILDGLLQAYRVAGDACRAEEARLVWRGLEHLASVSATPGFVARGVPPGRIDHYPNSSADQYTAFIYAAWAYGTSSICSAEDRNQATELVDRACRLIESFHDDIPREDMQPSIYGDTSACKPDRACRLLQFYRAASILTGESHWERAYRRAAQEDGGKRLACCEQTDPAASVYVWQQNAFALHLLYTTEDDPAWKALYARALDKTAALARLRTESWRPWMEGSHEPIIPWQVLAYSSGPKGAVDLTDYHAFTRRFREANPGKGNDDRHLRQATEALAIIMLAPGDANRLAIREEAWRALSAPDYGLSRTCHPLAAVEGAYWRGVVSGLFPG